MTKPDVLENFGTQIDGARLTPNAVLQAATEDFKRKSRNKQRQAGEIGGLDFEHFAFVRRHINRSNNPKELIALALRFQSIGLESGKKNTRLIYRDRPVLQGAYELAGGVGVIDKEPEKTDVSGPVNEG